MPELCTAEAQAKLVANQHNHRLAEKQRTALANRIKSRSDSGTDLAVNFQCNCGNCKSCTSIHKTMLGAVFCIPVRAWRGVHCRAHRKFAKRAPARRYLNAQNSRVLRDLQARCCTVPRAPTSRLLNQFSSDLLGALLRWLHGDLRISRKNVIARSDQKASLKMDRT